MGVSKCLIYIAVIWTFLFAKVQCLQQKNESVEDNDALVYLNFTESKVQVIK